MVNKKPASFAILGIAIALFCWGALVVVRVTLFDLDFALVPFLVEFSAVSVGAAIFWWWIVGILSRQARDIRRHISHLMGLHAAALALTTEHDVTKVLQQVVDLSRTLVGAKYGALAVLDERSEAITHFYTSGITPDARERIGHIPYGLGLLAIPLRQGKSIRVADIANDSRSHGFPPHHPVMHSLLGVPLVFKNRTLGILYLADKWVNQETSLSENTTQRTGEFAEEDTELLEMFALQAAIAIENARLYRQSQQVAVLQERERIGMDLHDGVIQSIYAIGLMLDDSRHRADQGTDFVYERLTTAINGLNGIIADIRTYIHDLRTHHTTQRGFSDQLEQWVLAMRRNTSARINIDLQPEALQALGEVQAQELLQIAREAVTNASKHAEATSITVSLRTVGDHMQLVVADNGVGMNYDDALREPGQGLKNILERTSALQGNHEYVSGSGDGTKLIVTFPV